MNELTNYQMWQAERYGNILPEPVIMPDGSCENGEDEIRRSAQWVQAQSEQQMHEQQF